MISKKSIIIFGVILVVLVGAFWGVNNLWKSPAETNPFVPGENNGKQIYSVPQENIVQMDVNLGAENFSFVKSGDKWVFRGDDTVRLLATEVNYLSLEFSGIYASECIEENAEDLAKYGLAEPTADFKIHLSDGSSKSFFIGYKDPTGGSYYFALEGDPNVYLIYESKANVMMRSATAYRNTSVLDVDVKKLSGVRVNKKGSVVLDVYKELIKSEESEEIKWHMSVPKTLSCNIEAIDDNIISKLSYITVEEFIDKKDSRYNSSGVNNPAAVIELTDDNGVSQTVYVGKKDGKNCYIKTDGRVYLIAYDSVSVVDVDPFIYVSKFVNLEYIDNVSKVEISHDGVTYTASIDDENGAKAYRLNGTAVMKDDFTRKIYQPTVCLLADDFAVSPSRGKTEYSIVTYLKDGSVKRMDFYNYDDRNYSVFTEKGKCDFVVRKKKIDDMFATLATIKAYKPQ